jgi:peptidyl-prolyl cis-trans isomerase B (cyclophilin B)
MIDRILAGAVLLAVLVSGAQAAEKPRVRLTTTSGEIVIELENQRARRTTENFLAYVRNGFYDGTIFHRVIADFMIQGGGFTESFSRKETQAPIRNEADNGLRNLRGTVAMARTGDPHSATAQFFINAVDNAFLDHRTPDARGWGYAVFGRVVEGMDVVDQIRKVPTGNRGRMQNVPRTAVVIQSARIDGE